MSNRWQSNLDSWFTGSSSKRSAIETDNEPVSSSQFNDTGDIENYEMQSPSAVPESPLATSSSCSLTDALDFDVDHSQVSDGAVELPGQTSDCEIPDGSPIRYVYIILSIPGTGRQFQIHHNSAPPLFNCFRRLCSPISTKMNLYTRQYQKIILKTSLIEIPVVSIIYGQQDHGVGPFVIKKCGTRVCGSLDHHMLSINGTYINFSY